MFDAIRLTRVDDPVGGDAGPDGEIDTDDGGGCSTISGGGLMLGLLACSRLRRRRSRSIV